MNKRLFFFTIAFLFSFNLHAQVIRYVSQTGAGLQNGTSWANAYPAASIQTAIDGVHAASGGQVWVAAGVYFPVEPFDNNLTDARRKSITIKSNVHLYGGFSGNETSVNQRNAFGEGQANETILSGDIGITGDSTDNSYHVVYVAISTTNTLINGFTIRHGNADQSTGENDGGGIWSRGVLIIENCVIKFNSVTDMGGGIFIGENSLIRNSILRNNTATNRGGGAYLLYFSTSTAPEPLVDNCLIYDNYSEYGGGVNLKTGGMVTHSRLIANTAKYGAGAYLESAGMLQNSLLANNQANFYGGGVYLYYGGTAINNTVVSNRANSGGGGVYRRYGSSGVKNSILWNNNSQFGYFGSGVGIEYCAVHGGYSSSGAGNGIINLATQNSGTAAVNYPRFNNPNTTIGYNAAQIQNFLTADWRLRCFSACIDTAEITLLPSSITTDLDGNPRVVDGNGNGTPKPDMGAYEYSANYYQTATLCLGDSLLFGNNYLKQAGNYQHAYSSANACDSIVHLSLSVISPDSLHLSAHLCHSDTFVYNNIQYYQPGVFYTSVPGPGVCDSIIKLTVTYSPPDTTLLPDTGYYQGFTYSFFGQSINTPGVYFHTLQNSFGCDSVIRQTITMIPVDTVIYGVFCRGSSYTFSGIALTTAGTYFSTVLSSSNADSTIRLNLAEMPVDSVELPLEYLNQGSVYNFYGQSVTTPGVYYHTLTSVAGCDSVIVQKFLARRYVRQNGSGSQNGYNWANAYPANQLQTAINQVSIAGGGQVWVAKGTYKPTTSNSRGLSFTIYQNIELIGGFSGNETSIQSRSSYGFNQTNETRLSGDINTPADTSDNSYIVIRQFAAGYCLIDGFTIRDACHPLTTAEGGGVLLKAGGVLRNSVVYNNFANYMGGGVFNDGGSIENCSILQNRSNSYGGGVLMKSGSITNSELTGNTAKMTGGGIYCIQDYGLIDSCTFTGNYTHSYGWGGALGLDVGVDTFTLRNSHFIGNSATLGGAFYNSANNRDIRIENCVFDGNSAIDWYASATNTTYDGVGGAAVFNEVSVSNTVFKNNTATKGGALYMLTNSKIHSSEFRSNSATKGGAVYMHQGGSISHSSITVNSAPSGGGIYMYQGGEILHSRIDSNIANNDGGGIFMEEGGTIKQCEIIANQAKNGAGAYAMTAGLVTLCDIHSNKASINGGGIYNHANTLPITNCHIFNNYAHHHGGGIYQNNSFNAHRNVVVNTNVFNNESRYDGGGVYAYLGGTLINCNVNRNKAGGNAGGVYIQSRVKIKNSVIWGNSSQIFLTGYGTPLEIDTTAVQNGYSGTAAGSMVMTLDTLNQGTDTLNYPMYILPTSFVGNISGMADSLELMAADWNLNCGSPLIDAGNNLRIPDTTSLDLNGMIRIADGNNDSVAVIDLGPLEAHYHFNLNIALCSGDTFFLGNQAITQAGTYSGTLMSVNGCDSLVTLFVSLHQGDSVQVSHTSCSNAGYFFNGQHLTTSGIYTNTFANMFGCDSVVQLNLNILPVDSAFIQQTICQGSSFVYNGKAYFQPGTYYDTLVAANSCDSIVKISIQLNPVDTTVATASICAGNTYNFHGINLSASGTYYHPLQNVFGCDSIIKLNLSVFSVDTLLSTQTVCQGTGYNFYGNTLYQQGMYYHSLLSSNNCDSVIALNLVVNPRDSINLAAAICQGGSYTFHGQNLTASGTYSHTLQNSFGCDSIICLNLSVNPVDTTVLNEFVCNTQNYNFFGTILDSSGTYFHTLSSLALCDSVIKLNLHFNAADTQSIHQSICFGDSVLYYGNWLSQPGTYYQNFQNQNNCDSVIAFSLSVNAHTFSSINANACRIYTSPGGSQQWSQSGVYSDTLVNAAGCDSIISIHLTIHAMDTSLTYTPPVLSSNYPNAIAYQWIDCNTQTPVAGAVSAAFTPATNGSYAVIITDSFCVDTSVCYLVSDVGIGTDAGISPGVTVFPNPTNGSFTVSFDRLRKDIRLELFSAEGVSLLNSIYAEAERIELHIAQPSGVYFLVIQDKHSGITRHRIVVVR